MEYKYGERGNENGVIRTGHGGCAPYLEWGDFGD